MKSNIVQLGSGSYPGPAGGDFYQLWLGARALLSGSSPYGAAVQHEMIQAYGKWGQHGLPYPLPAVMAVTPFALLPLGAALVVWLGLNLTAVACSAFLQRAWRYQLVLPLLFYPLFRTVGLRQPTLMWVGLTIVLVLALQRRWSLLAGFCLALLPAKPQTGLVFAIAGAIWAVRYQRHTILWGVFWSIVLWGGSFVLIPAWPGAALTSILRYRELYPAPSLLPLGLLVIIAAYRLPWWGIAAPVQMILFPIHDVYGALPLLLGWTAIGGPLALLGAALSWSWLAMSDFPFLAKLWLSMLLPFAAAALWRASAEMRSRWWHGKRRLIATMLPDNLPGVNRKR